MTAKKEKQLNEAYQDFIRTAIYDMPLDTLEEFVAKNIMGFGTAKDETIVSLAEYRVVLSRQKEQANGIEMNIDSKPVFRSIIGDENSAIFVDEFTITMMVGGGKNELFLRLTTVLEYLDDTWKVVHFHGSKPAEIEGATDSWHVNEWQRRNEALQQLVTEKTADLEEKNRELLLESSLERVRAIAMGMRNPADLLDICEILFAELHNMGFSELRNTMINIHDDDKGSFLNYDFSEDAGKTITHHFYNSHPVIENQVKQVRSSKDAFSETIFAGKDLEDWKAFRKEKGEKDDPKVDAIPALFYYFYSIGNGAIGISTYSSITEEKRNILKRFRNVFDFAYQRYTDVTQAEAQAKEAKLELGLERVRARAMAMQHSDELAELVTVVFKELTQLDFVLTSCIIWINHPESLTNTLWVTSSEMNQPAQPIFLTPFQHPFFKSIIHAWKANDPKWVFTLTGHEKQSFEAAFFKEEPGLPTALKSALTVPGKVVFSASFNHFGALEIVGTEPLSDEKFDILHRFGKVFDSSYTRFNDLKKAEAQAREAQIELALERVRARTMAMQKSEELSETAYVLFQQFKELGEDPEQLTIGIFNEPERTIELWLTLHGDRMSEKFIVSIDEPMVINKIYTAWKQQQRTLVIDLTGKALKDYNDYRNSLRSGIRVNNDRTEHRRVMNFAFFSKGNLSISGPDPLPAQGIQLLERFANVFDLTYTRFLDLKNAEAQAREAQVELALERVRARTMAMQHSEELQEAANLLFQQVQTLGIPVWTCGYNIWEPGEKFCTGWMSTNGSIQPSFRIPLTESPTFIHINESRLKGEPFFVEEVSGEALAAHYRYMFSLPDFKEIASEQLKDGFVLPLSQIHNVFNFKHGNLIFISGTPVPESWDVFKRFAKVFEQTYIRFLDLQKAEAQARESQIEAALEKVRSRSLAMHKSEELQEVVFAVFDRLRDLNIKTGSANILIFHDDKNVIEQWVANDMNYADLFKVPYNTGYYSKEFYESKKQQGQFQKIYSKQENKEKFEEGFKHSDFARISETRKTFLLSLEGATEVAAFGRSSAIVLYRYEVQPFSDAEIELLKRFAKVFEQTYTRFLDLQKAEAQAREARIETALEKIRSRSLAMHKSDELWEVIAVVFEKLQELNFSIDGAAFIVTFVEGSRVLNTWLADDQGQMYPTILRLPYYDSPSINDMWLAKESGLDFFSKTYSFEEKNHWLSYAFEHTDLKIMTEEFKNWILEQPCLTQSFALGKNSMIGVHFHHHKTLAETEVDILKRFSKVFDQAYIRFLDLQKAEAQAREAKIEAALERARTQSMIMQHSKELDDILLVFHEQVQLLGINSAFSFLWLPDEKKDRHIFWAAWAENVSPTLVVDHNSTVFKSKAINYPLDRNDPATAQCLVDWKSNEPIVSYHVPPSGVENYFAAWQELIDGVEQLKPEYFSGGLYYVEAFMKYGCFGVMVATDLTEDEKKILGRFAIEFERAYTRFLDLQKAEAQAREAQIELGLERVRARAMAMQKSGELSELVDTVFKELTKLDFALTWCIINIIDESSMSNTVWAANPDIDKAPESYHMLFEDYPFHHAMMKGWKERKTKSVYTLEGDEKRIYDNYLFSETEFKRTPEAAQKASRAMEKYVVSFSFSNFGGLQTVGEVPLSDANLDILSRFGKVFDLTYTRFNDLKQAEAQAREAQIQLALERVRARTMAMQKSDELKEAAALLFQQAKALGVPAYSCGYNIWEKNDKTFTSWMSTQDGSIINGVPDIPLTEDANFIRYVESKQKDEQFFVLELRGERMQEHYEYLKTIPAFKAYFDYAISVGFDLPETQIHYLANFSHGNLLFISLEPCPEFHDVFKRFALVFEQTYTRFLDLQKAEEQARESQIEAALERVRSRSMGMQKSEELKEVIKVVFDQFVHLNINLDHAGFVVDYQPKADWHFWIADKQEIPSKITHPYFTSVWANQFDEAKEKGIDFFATNLNFEEKNKFYQELFSYIPGLSEESKQFYFDSPGLTASNVLLENVALYIENFSAIPYTEEENAVLMRFGKVFQQTYTRFLDLQKAEAQAREAQIETALERVRSRTMAMQRSGELAEVATVLFQQVKALGVPQWTCGFSIFEIDDKEFTWYPGGPGGEILTPCKIPLTEHPVFISFNESRKRGDELYIYEKTGEVQANHYRYMCSLPVIGEYMQSRLDAGEEIPAFQIDHLANFSHGNLIFITYEHFPEMHDVFKRFAKVFEQTYTRFLDLQKAEAQAREAQIEAALERVRSRTMGMQKSNELREVIQVIHDQFLQLNIPISGAGFAMDYMESDDFNFWLADTFSSFPSLVHVPYFDHPQFNRYKQAKENGLDFYTSQLTSEEKNTFFDHVSKYVHIPDNLKVAVYKQPGYGSSHVVLKNVMLYILNFTGLPFSNEENATLMRFGKVFEQTYIRFNDLKQAEAQAMEAIKRASVDRVRAEIASMRTTNDLERITPLIWNELTTLGVPFIRCGVFIMDEVNEQIQTLLSTSDGKAIASFQLPFDNTEPLPQLLPHWRRKEIYKDHWDEAAFIESTKILLQRGAIASPEIYSTKHRPTELNLHFLPFLQGMLYVGSETPLNENELQLVQNLADAFSIAYARYEDFNKLESANIKIEKTLVDLKQAQAQLVQSEKMASLGELTAGIAHEIQNPLNFVNNFSEVSNELIDEMVEEVNKGNYEEVKLIADDVKQNLEKINHHGKRAEAIVKGMLQHSSTSSAVKEPTHINKLADEYLRLAYHGLRAKDKSFNATMLTDYDRSIDTIDIIPQDIGRVVLNLINNAFYAVTEKKKQALENYEPTVSVSTKKTGDIIFISVKDNGKGIPQKLVDKIFQPFFTTKPTGQGTGLGLSLSYDIVKAHGGEIKVESKEGQGSEFIIILPII